MKASVFALAIVLLAGPAFAGRSLNLFETFEGPQSGSCAVEGSLKFVVKHGSCSGQAKAACTTHTDADGIIVRATAIARTDGLCSPVSAQALAQATATAIAQVYVESLANVTCNGLGFGCGFALAEGDAFAAAYAKAFANAVAVAMNDKLGAICFAQLESVAVGIAEAAAFAVTKACVNGNGSAEVFRSRFIERTIILLVEAMAKATAEICDEEKDTAECNSEVSGKSEDLRPASILDAQGSTSSAGTGIFGPPTTSGDAGISSTVAKVKPCEGLNSACCNEPCSIGFLGPDVSGQHNLLLQDFTGKTLCWCH